MTNTNTNPTIAELKIANKKSHATRFAVVVDGMVYGIQARANLVDGPKAGKVNAVKKAHSVSLIAVPVEQASGFDRISATLRKVGVAGRDVLPLLERSYLPLSVNWEVTGQVENKAGELVDKYEMASAVVEGFNTEDIVTVALLKDMDESAVGREIEHFEKAPMSESVKANAAKMKANAAKMKAEAAAAK